MIERSGGQVPHMHQLIESSLHSSEVGTTIIPILEIRKLRHRERTDLIKSCRWEVAEYDSNMGFSDSHNLLIHRIYHPVLFFYKFIYLFLAALGLHC